MATLLVGVPVIRDYRKVHVQKGRWWSVFEHAVLEAVAKRDWQLLDLSAHAALPQRVVVEILIRLMRAGWVEIVYLDGRSVFRATSLGRVRATLEELPPVTTIKPRHLSYAVELISGQVFRRSDLSLVNEDQWKERIAGHRAVKLATPKLGMYDIVPVSLLADTLLDDDEQLASVDPSDWKPTRLTAVVTVSNGKLDGLGPNVSAALLKAILDSTKSLKAPQNGDGRAPTVKVEPVRLTRERRQINWRGDDLLTGGAAHRKALLAAIGEARHRIVIHSTFLDQERFVPVWQALRTAALRGVSIDLLWGQTSIVDGKNKSLATAAYIREQIAMNSLQARVRISSGPSRSHSKLVLWDRGNPAQFSALIGSCNWLASDFAAFEVSARLRDYGIVSDIAFELAELARPLDGQVSELSTALLALGRELRGRAEGTGNATAQLVLGPQHGDFVLRARDSAKSRITLLSHQLGFSALPNLRPLEVAAAAVPPVQCDVHYGKFADGIDVARATSELLERSSQNLRIRPVQRPRLHAKVLAWDSSDVVVTSQNWLSADPGESALRKEIGVHLTAPRVAETLRQRLELSKDW